MMEWMQANWQVIAVVVAVVVIVERLDKILATLRSIESRLNRDAGT
jgi:hypothetical protein